MIGREINLGSPKQLQEMLFDELGMPKTKRTKTGYTTDADALQCAVRADRAPVPGARCCGTATRPGSRSTVDGLLKSVADDGRIHTTYNQTIAATGRLSSTDPNLQNIPIRTEEGRRIREAFVVGAGYESLLTADYSQIEMRIMAHLSEDEALIEAFHSGEDLHAFTASRVFGVAPGDVTPSMRRQDQGDELRPGLRAVARSACPSSSASAPTRPRGLMDEYFERFGGVRDYLRDVVAEARRTGYTETILGRRRYLPDLTSDNRQRREMAERMALNAPIQGSAADIIKVAMLGVDRALRDDRAALAGCCCRCTTSWCSRWRPGSGTRSRRWSAARWARAYELRGAAGRVGRRRPDLARRRPLTAPGRAACRRRRRSVNG